MDEVDELKLPYYLRENSPPLCECTVCGRKSWSADEINRECRMPQPQPQPGVICGGRMRPCGNG